MNQGGSENIDVDFLKFEVSWMNRMKWESWWKRKTGLAWYEAGMNYILTCATILGKFFGNFSDNCQESFPLVSAD